MVGQGERIGSIDYGCDGVIGLSSLSIHIVVLSIPYLWCSMCSSELSEKGMTGNACHTGNTITP